MLNSVAATPPEAPAAPSTTTVVSSSLDAPTEQEHQTNPVAAALNTILSSSSAASSSSSSSTNSSTNVIIPNNNSNQNSSREQQQEQQVAEQTDESEMSSRRTNSIIINKSQFSDAEREKLETFTLFTPFNTLVLFTLINFVTYYDRGVVAPAITVIRVDKEITDGGPPLTGSQSGALFSAFMFGFFVTCPLAVGLGGTLTTKTIVIVGLVAWCAAVLLAGLAETYWVLLLARAMTGIGEAAYAGFLITITDNMAPRRKRGTWVAVFMSMIPFGNAVGIAINGVVASKSFGSDGRLPGWRVGFFLEAIPMVVLTALIGFLPREYNIRLEDRHHHHQQHQQNHHRHHHDDTSSSHVHILTALYKLLSNTKYVAASLGCAAYTFTLGSLSFFAVSMLVHSNYDVTVVEASVALGLCVSVCGLSGSVVGGWLIDKMPAGGEHRSSNSSSRQQQQQQQQQQLQELSAPRTVVASSSSSPNQEEEDDAPVLSRHHHQQQQEQEQEQAVASASTTTTPQQLYNCTWLMTVSMLVSFPFGIAALYMPSFTWFCLLIVPAVFFAFLYTASMNLMLLSIVPPELRTYSVALNVFIIHLLGDWPSPMLTGWFSDLYNGGCADYNKDAQGCALHQVSSSSSPLKCKFIPGRNANEQPSCVNPEELFSAMRIVWCAMLLAVPLWGWLAYGYRRAAKKMALSSSSSSHSASGNV